MQKWNTNYALCDGWMLVMNGLSQVRQSSNIHFHGQSAVHSTSAIPQHISDTPAMLPQSTRDYTTSASGQTSTAMKRLPQANCIYFTPENQCETPEGYSCSHHQRHLVDVKGFVAAEFGSLLLQPPPASGPSHQGSSQQSHGAQCQTHSQGQSGAHSS
jgi:hypothetical protein